MSQELQQEIDNLRKENEGRKNHAEHVERVLKIATNKGEVKRRIIDFLINDNIETATQNRLNEEEKFDKHREIQELNNHVSILQNRINALEKELTTAQSALCNHQENVKNIADAPSKRGRKKKTA